MRFAEFHVSRQCAFGLEDNPNFPCGLFTSLFLSSHLRLIKHHLSIRRNSAKLPSFPRWIMRFAEFHVSRTNAQRPMNKIASFCDAITTRFCSFGHSDGNLTHCGWRRRPHVFQVCQIKNFPYDLFWIVGDYSSCCCPAKKGRIFIILCRLLRWSRQ